MNTIVVTEDMHLSDNAPVWKENQPIYLQITNLMIGRVLDRTYLEGEMFPSARQIADEFDVSMITAAKVFQELDLRNITVKRRGLGSEVKQGSRDEILARQRKNFLTKEIPELKQRLARMELSVDDLVSALES